MISDLHFSVYIRFCCFEQKNILQSSQRVGISLVVKTEEGTHIQTKNGWMRNKRLAHCRAQISGYLMHQRYYSDTAPLKM